MSKEEYIKSFPFDEYDNETDYRGWEKEDKVFEKTDSSKINGQWSIGNRQFATGIYEIEITTKDKDGSEVKDVKYVELYDQKSNQLDHPEYLWTESSKPIEPGERTTNKVGTSTTDVFLIQQIDKLTGNGQQATSNFQIVKLNNEKRSFDFSAIEADRK